MLPYLILNPLWSMRGLWSPPLCPVPPVSESEPDTDSDPDDAAYSAVVADLDKAVPTVDVRAAAT
jgi:hypothetical protein